MDVLLPSFCTPDRISAAAQCNVELQKYQEPFLWLR
jgi:hypothetical protein